MNGDFTRFKCLKNSMKNATESKIKPINRGVRILDDPPPIYVAAYIAEIIPPAKYIIPGKSNFSFSTFVGFDFGIKHKAKTNTIIPIGILIWKIHCHV